MALNRSSEYLAGVVDNLRKFPSESEWVEFKLNFNDLQGIGEYISALANGAALVEKPHAYIVWGIEDETHAIIGTTFSPLSA